MPVAGTSPGLATTDVPGFLSLRLRNTRAQGAAAPNLGLSECEFLPEDLRELCQSFFRVAAQQLRAGHGADWAGLSVLSLWVGTRL